MDRTNTKEFKDYIDKQFISSILDTSFMQKFDYSQCNEDDSPLWDDVMKNNNIKAFMTVFENNRTKSSEIIYKNISEILSNIP